MKRVFVCFILFLLWSLPTQVLAVQEGYAESVSWWHDVHQKMVPYELQLQKMYAEVEATPGLLPSKVVQEFRRRLSREFPGSNYFGQSGIFKINNYTTLGFSQNWQINRLTQQFGDLRKSYDFNQNSMTLESGPNRISFRIDLKSPERSQFTTVKIPAISVSASQVYQSRPNAKKNLDGLSNVIDDVYRLGILPPSVGRMDQYAEQLLAEITFREEVLSQARQLYLDPPKELLDSSKERSLLPGIIEKSAKGIKTPTDLFGAALRSIPWYVYLVFLGIIVASGLTTTRRVKRYAKKLSLFELLIRYLFSKHEHTSAASYESRSTLNSPAEQKFQEALEEVLDTELYTLNGKTRLADILKVKDGFGFGKEQAVFNRISRKHVDFVITEKQSSRIIGVIELDDRSHQRADRRNRDQQVDQWLKSADIPILHYPCRREYSFVDLQQTLLEVFGIAPQPFGDFR